MFKKIILTFIGIALLLGFQASVSANSFYEKEKVADFLQDENSNEESSESKNSKNCELENFKFFHNFADNFAILKISPRFALKDQFVLQKNFFEVLTSPPNA